PLNSYTDILACHDAEDDALRGIHYLWDRYHTQALVCETRFFVHLPSGRQITNHEIHAFGPKNNICCKKFVIDEHLELAARRSHEMYARKELAKIAADLSVEKETREVVASLLNEVSNNEISLNAALKRYDALQNNQAKKLAWDNLSLFKRDSNKAEYRHMKIKLAALKLETPDLKNNDVIEQVKTFPWPKLDEFSEAELDRGPAFQMLTQAKMATGLDLEQIKLCIDDLAEAEHARWNAFHVLNNYRYGDTKNECLRTHDCLLGWQQMGEKTPGKVKYDYQNVYEIYAVLNAVH
ncbi:MAG: hypothetical protein V2I51_17865, partial [Anderseniella sp.]|nr:hypothetical protein [Anderseniella sp.]